MKEEEEKEEEVRGEEEEQIEEEEGEEKGKYRSYIIIKQKGNLVSSQKKETSFQKSKNQH